MKIDLYQRANIGIGEIASSAEYQMDEKLQNFKFLEQNFGFLNWIFFFRNLLIFQIRQFRKFPIRKIRKIRIFQKLSILKNPKIYKILQFRTSSNFWNFTICRTIEILQIPNFINYHIFLVF